MFEAEEVVQSLKGTLIVYIKEVYAYVVIGLSRVKEGRYNNY